MVTAYVRIEAASAETVESALERLGKKMRITKRSANYGEDRVVCVCEIDESKSPQELQQEVNDATGRIVAQVILYDLLAINLPDLIIPLPGLENDKPALQGLAEIAPTLQHPLLGRTMESLATS